jgi:8-hydroxy-5-deazaflavin:NADPH oxidoreductase
MPDRSIRTVGILGAGRVGTAIARRALEAGYEVLLATSRPGSEIELIVEVMVPGARAVSADEAARESDLVVLAVPLHRYRTLLPEALRDRIVIDAMNYWPPTDGVHEEFGGEESSSEVVQRFLPETRLVRTLNHIGYNEIEDEGLPAGHPRRRALAIAGDDPEARRVVGEFVDRLGFDPVEAGTLAAARLFVPGTPIFEGRFTRDEMERELAMGTALREQVA